MNVLSFYFASYLIKLEGYDSMQVESKATGKSMRFVQELISTVLFMIIFSVMWYVNEVALTNTCTRNNCSSLFSRFYAFVVYVSAHLVDFLLLYSDNLDI